MQATLRIATKEDIPAIHQLVRELAIYEKEEAAFVATIEEYYQDFEQNWFEAVVAEMDNKVVGMALFYNTYSTWKGRMLYLEDFVLNQAYRRFGIGQLVFDEVIKIAKEKGCKLVKWQVLDWNEPAIKFYEKNNAIIEKEWWNGKIVFPEGGEITL